MVPSLEYIAGFFDGEGCICIKQETHSLAKCSKVYYVLCVVLSNNHKEVLETIKDRFKFGYLYTRRLPGHTYLSHKYQVSKKEDVKKFLEQIKPYSIVKRAEIDYVLKHWPANRLRDYDTMRGLKEVQWEK